MFSVCSPPRYLFQFLFACSIRACARKSELATTTKQTTEIGPKSHGSAVVVIPSCIHRFHAGVGSIVFLLLGSGDGDARSRRVASTDRALLLNYYLLCRITVDILPPLSRDGGRVREEEAYYGPTKSGCCKLGKGRRVSF